MTYQPEWRAEDERRMRMLDYLFFVDGRDDKSHPDHALYTGLAEKYRGTEHYGKEI